MSLVDYPSSSDEELESVVSRVSKKRKIDRAHETKPTAGTLPMPSLPATFRDLYSSTVRTSTQDDPQLHAGRRRATPHVAGHWPTHVYLEWYPGTTEDKLLAKLIAHADAAAAAAAAAALSQDTTAATTTRNAGSSRISSSIHSLLENDLGVALPLHVSLSRPLVLRTDQKDSFSSRLRSAIASSGAHAFRAQPLDLVWHPNEDRTRWFLVLRLARPEDDELRKLLQVCNQLASEFGQPLLYTSADLERASDAHDSFHVSIAWSLQPPPGSTSTETNRHVAVSVAVPADLKRDLTASHISFNEVKLRVGQDVTLLALRPMRSQVTGHGTALGKPDDREG